MLLMPSCPKGSTLQQGCRVEGPNGPLPSARPGRHGSGCPPALFVLDVWALQVITHDKVPSALCFVAFVVFVTGPD